MKTINIIVEGSTEETFVNDVLVRHFARLDKFIFARKIRTGWDKLHNKPAKGGLLKYIKFKNDVIRWIESDRDKTNTFYTSFIDLYAFPQDNKSPYALNIRNIISPYQKVNALEEAIKNDINHPCFIPYVQLHEFEAFLMVEPNLLLYMYPDDRIAIRRLKSDIGFQNPEEINDSPHTAPSKRIIRFIPAYEGQKEQVGPLIASDIGIDKLRAKCPHFNEWITKLENL